MAPYPTLSATAMLNQRSSFLTLTFLGESYWQYTLEYYRKASVVRRVSVARVSRSNSLIDYLEAGETLDEFLDNFPSVTREAAIASLE
jgi:hypothetical protein